MSFFNKYDGSDKFFPEKLIQKGKNEFSPCSPPTPSSPIDELLLEFMHDDLKKEQWPAFDKDFYSKLFKLQTERNIENFIELEENIENIKISDNKESSSLKKINPDHSGLEKINPIHLEKNLFTSRPYHCDFFGCGYKATQSCHLTRHMRSHKVFINKKKGIYPCQYSGCNYSASKCVLLKNHMLSHTN